MAAAASQVPKPGAAAGGDHRFAGSAPGLRLGRTPQPTRGRRREVDAASRGRAGFGFRVGGSRRWPISSWFDYDQRARSSTPRPRFGHSGGCHRRRDSRPGSTSPMRWRTGRRRSTAPAPSSSWIPKAPIPGTRSASSCTSTGGSPPPSRPTTARRSEARAPAPVSLLINRATVVARVGRLEEAQRNTRRRSPSIRRMLRHAFVNHEYGVGPGPAGTDDRGRPPTAPGSRARRPSGPARFARWRCSRRTADGSPGRASCWTTRSRAAPRPATRWARRSGICCAPRSP